MRCPLPSGRAGRWPGSERCSVARPLLGRGRARVSDPPVGCSLPWPPHLRGYPHCPLCLVRTVDLLIRGSRCRRRHCGRRGELHKPPESCSEGRGSCPPCCVGCSPSLLSSQGSLEALDRCP